MKQVSRRKAIGAAGAAVGAFFAGKLVGTAAAAKEETPKSTPTPVWRPLKLDPKAVADRAYKLYAEGRCMFASFNALRLEMAAACADSDPVFSKALTDFPGHMMVYGHNGLGKMGTLCGAINGCAAMFGLLTPDKAIIDPMIAELCNYYEQTELPIYKPENSKFEPMAKSKATSPLCHISQTMWCRKSGHSQFSDFRSDRCKRLSADCAAKAAEILNRYVDSPKSKGKLIPSDSQACTACHGQNGVAGNVSAKMNCTTCHTMEDHY